MKTYILIGVDADGGQAYISPQFEACSPLAALRLFLEWRADELEDPDYDPDWDDISINVVMECGVHPVFHELSDVTDGSLIDLLA